ncbi:MAG: hypothetical protein JNM17_17765 [Archangium sp.]|nr:hypothetical protein [Archangium sp.]
MIPAALRCPGEWLHWSDERGLPWLMRQTEATGHGKREWHLTEAERAEGLQACDDAIEALEALARLLPPNADIIPEDSITSPIGQLIFRNEPRRFSRIRLGTRRQVFVQVKEALLASVPRKTRDLNLDDLFAQILARPHDEEVRLVFADAIGASDPEYAEFVVTQIDARRMKRAGQQPTGVMRDRMDVLLKKYGDLWSNGLQHHASNFTFRSGFVEHVALSTDVFVRDAATIFARAPIRHVTFTEVSRSFFNAVTLPQFQQLAIIAFHAEAMPAEARGSTIFLQHPQLPNLKVVDLRGVPNATRNVRMPAPNLKHVLIKGDEAPDLDVF